VGLSKRKLPLIDRYGESADDVDRPVDEYGQPVELTKEESPYGYSPFVTWRRPGTRGPSMHGTYSDRLLEADWDKHNRLCQKHFGDEAQWWHSRSPEKIEAFLRDYFGACGQETAAAETNPGRLASRGMSVIECTKQCGGARFSERFQLRGARMLSQRLAALLFARSPVSWTAGQPRPIVLR